MDPLDMFIGSFDFWMSKSKIPWAGAAVFPRFLEGVPDLALETWER
jgi:hypothetical protein